ncbi:class I SAM-dependent methyltransferase [Leptolyngbya sp. FACHB-671]|uniref:class I SAM-dependent methyltransferase n=1 Tax=Leptolyngbya sp. FACHB-671 TaxID=2692812 RepID=UPI001682DAE0|nr:class I SAM-dependent methyltransferase [Leptolyngbya sp. FACHB-671]MBD2071573.1 class I SAM-dependent methyltransferase [Leptolyngbya sp. FACHB-671]
MLDDNNRKLYTARGIVQHYTQLKMLQPAEQTILERFQNQWSSMRMLDIGVGGGRTTRHFSKLVLEYVGIDYSTEMIGACQKRFAASSDTTFEVCDARDMSQFKDNTFDFIMFSFNGIDYVSHSDRLKVLQEVSRVSKPGGYFFFSSHNLQRIEREFNWKNQMSLNPITTYVNLVMLTLLRCFNYSTTLEQLSLSTHATVKDESHNFRLKTYYVRPQEQINQLEAGFSNIQVYSWKNGLELKTKNEWSANTDMWLYYLCTIK